MRLLNVTTEQLESFYGDNIPGYAILSHMWGCEDNEVLFKHIAGSDDDRREGKGRKGYLKLSAACKQARDDGWKYIWIDTCCINKESSTELSEAINSMYAWYQRSEVCYAYLRDTRHEDGISGFKKSRWFTRGWTLQELIAPRRVVFYSSDWADIGTKASMQHIISSVTGIRVEMITNCDPDKASVAEKMSWAAKRETTRAEDIAYCLMGLLGVNMPLLYGEGKRAFRRLQEEIMKNSDDHSIFAWRIYHSRHEPNCLDLLSEARGMLADSPSDFQGVGDVVRSNNDSPYSAYSMSNRGLQIALPIQPVNPTDEELIGVDLADSRNIFKAILDCTYRDTNPTRWVVIYLKMVGKGRCVRIFPYWLNDIPMNPSEAVTDGWEVTSLVIPQVNTSTISLDPPPKSLFFDILPTKSGYCPYSSITRSRYSSTRWKPGIDVVIFYQNGKRFGVVIGSGSGPVWMDIITENDFEELSLPTTEYSAIKEIKLLYKEGGSRCNRTALQRLNFLCINVSKDHSVNVSGKLIHSSYEVTIDIQEIVTEEIPTHDGHGFDPRNVPLNFKKEGINWFTVFNPKVQRTLDVSPVPSVTSNEVPERIILSPDGKYLATADHGRLCIYNATTGDTACVLGDFLRELDHINYMCFSTDSSRFAIYTNGSPGYISVWDINNKYPIRHFSFKQSYSRVLRFTPDSRFIISAPSSGVIQSLDVINGTSKTIWDSEHETSNGMAISPDGWFIARYCKTYIRIWDMEGTRMVAELQVRDQDVDNIMFTPDGKRLLGIKKNKTLQYWYIGGLTTVEVKPEKGHSNDTISPVNVRARDVERSSHRNTTLSSVIRDKHTISDVAMSHDGRWITTVTDIGIQFWDSMNGTLQFTLRSRTSENFLFSISSAVNIFATYAYGSNKVQIWKYDDISQS